MLVTVQLGPTVCLSLLLTLKEKSVKYKFHLASYQEKILKHQSGGWHTTDKILSSYQFRKCSFVGSHCFTYSLDAFKLQQESSVVDTQAALPTKTETLTLSGHLQKIHQTLIQMFRDGDILKPFFPKKKVSWSLLHRSKKTWIIRGVVLNIPQQGRLFTEE